MDAGAAEFEMRLVDHVTVKGKEEPCKIYEVINGDEVSPLFFFLFVRFLKGIDREGKREMK